MTQYHFPKMSKLVASQYEAEKSDWIRRNASNHLQGMIAAGYEANDLYVLERLSIDFPEFELTGDLSIVKADSPPEFCLLACENFIGAYCSVTKYTLSETFYITIDNFLGGISIAKKIQLPVFKTKTKDEDFDILKQSTPNIQSEDPYNQEKKEWIFICGSDLLKQSFQDGYDSEERYVNERAESDFPGFTFGDDSFDRIDSPNKYLLQQSYSITNAYCANHRYDKYECYLVIDNYLGKHKIIKLIPNINQVILQESNSRNYSIGRWYPRLLAFFSVSFFLIGFLNMLMSKPIPIPPIHEKNSLPIPLIQKQISNTEVRIAKNNYK
jgi:hypothetical protein